MTRHGFGGLSKKTESRGQLTKFVWFLVRSWERVGSWSLEKTLEVDEVEYSCCVQWWRRRPEMRWDLRLGLVQISNGSSPMQRQESVLDHKSLLERRQWVLFTEDYFEIRFC